MRRDFLIERLEGLLKKAEVLKANTFETVEEDLNGVEYQGERVDLFKMKRFRLLSLSFIEKIYDNQNLYYKTFYESSKNNFIFNLLDSEVVLISIKDEIESGWINELKDLVSADIFSDFLDMAKYFLDEKYKDAAAVIIGSVLEKHLKNVAEKNEIELFIEKDGKSIPKKISVINDELYKKSIYNKIVHKSIIHIFSIRNEAAHGNYGLYTQKDVDLMFESVSQILSKTG